MSCEYTQWIQNYIDMEASDGTPDENKEFEDLEGIEQDIYPDEEPLRIHNTDSETDAVMVEHQREKEHMISIITTKDASHDPDEPDFDEQEEDENIPTESEELFRDKKKDPRTYCIWCGKVSKPLLCVSCRPKTIKNRILQRLNSP